MTFDELQKCNFDFIRISDKELQERCIRSRKKMVIFATISVCADKSLFYSDGKFNEKAYRLYNERNRERFVENIQSIGFDYQSISGGWCDGINEVFLVWNNCYKWERFLKALLKLSELYKQRDICIGRYIDGRLKISYWATDDMNDINYIQTTTCTTDSVEDALNDYSTMMLSKYRGSENGCEEKTLTLGELQRSCRATAEGTVMGEYCRDARIKSLFGLNPYLPVTIWGPNYSIQDALDEINKLQC